MKIRKLILTALSCFLLLTPFSVHAADKDLPSVQRLGGTTFVGEYADKLSLSYDNEYFFQQDIMDPGDTWESHIYIKNKSGHNLDISLLQILNKLSDYMLIDNLDLRITLPDGTVVYDGKYSRTVAPVIDWYSLKAGDTLDIEVITHFPEESGNEYQAKPFEAEWVFATRMEEPKPEPSVTPTPTPEPTPEPSPEPTPSPDDETEITDEEMTDENTEDTTEQEEEETDDKTNDQNSRDDGVPTGDNTNRGIWGIAAGVSFVLGATVVISVVNKKKKEEEDDEKEN